MRRQVKTGTSTVLYQNPLFRFIEKWSSLDPKKFYVITFQKLVFLISLCTKFLEKNQRNKKS